MNKSDRCHLNQVIRVSSVMTQIKIHHLCDILAKDASFECNHEKVYNPKFKNIPQNNWLLIFKSIRIMKVQERTRSYFELKNTWQLNEYVILNLILMIYRTLLGQLEKPEWSLKIRWKNVLILLLKFWWLHCDFVGEYPCLLEIHTEDFRGDRV